MGRLPLLFAGKDITFRLPYEFYAELDCDGDTNGQVFPEAAFLHNIDKPFEMHRMIPTLTGLNEAGAVMEPQPTTLEKLVRLKLTDLSKNENLTKTGVPVENMVKANEGTWEWDEPYTFEKSESFQVQVDVDALPLVCQNTAVDGAACNSIATQVSQTRVQIGFQGFLIVVAPPTSTR